LTSISKTKHRAAPTRRRLFLFALLACAVVPARAEAQDVRRFDLALKAGELPRDQRTIKVKEGESVELHWTSDQPVRLHLHGYDIEVAVKPGEPAVTALRARIAGRFSVEKLQDKPGGHHHGGRVLYLEVHP
jgi:ferric-dicitrate binding protein FerR (iron transport regulator)